MRTLYVSYDGMTDNLGASQVIPYLEGLAGRGHEITLLSCEKPGRWRERGAAIRAQLERSGIAWEPILYHKRPPVLSTVWDIFRLGRRAAALHRSRRFEVLHCRSYIPALIGLRLKRREGLPLIFDMRGFWADERVDGGIWRLEHPLFRLIYKYFKRVERELLRESEKVISLTESGQDEMLRWKLDLPPGALAEKITVIPCCVDLDHFDPARFTPAQVQARRAELGLGRTEPVVVYLGSLGTWYLLEEMLGVFAQIQARHPGAIFLLITPDDPAPVHRLAAQSGLDPGCLRVVSAGRAEVPLLLATAQLGLSLIRPSYSKISSSATKLGEMLAMGLPVIANHGVGDQSRLFARHPWGHLMHDFSAAEARQAAEKVAGFAGLDRAEIRRSARHCFALERGVERYARVYDSVVEVREKE